MTRSVSKSALHHHHNPFIRGSAFRDAPLLHRQFYCGCYSLVGMIYMRNTTVLQRVRFPDNGLVAGVTSGKLHLISNVSRVEAWVETETIAAVSKLYYDVTFRLSSGLKSGEYTYELRDVTSEQMLSSGVLQIGEYTASKPTAGAATFEVKQAN